jgi:hypothetical protein
LAAKVRLLFLRSKKKAKNEVRKSIFLVMFGEKRRTFAARVIETNN